MSLGGRQVLVAGVLFDEELRLKQWWHVRGEHPTSPDEALAGARLAQILNLEPGDSLDVKGQLVRVVGVLAENGSQDDDILFIDLSVAQRMMNKPDGISLVEVAALCTACPIDEMVDQISAALPQGRVTALRQAVTLRMETVGQLTRFAVAVSAVVIAIGTLVVLTSMLGAVSERRQEIGLFRALGFRQGHIVRVILSEACLISLSGGVVGWLLGMGTAVMLAPFVAQVTAQVSWDPWLAVSTVGGALLIGLLGSLYPAIHAAKLDPTTALRSL